MPTKYLVVLQKSAVLLIVEFKHPKCVGIRRKVPM